MYAWFKKTVGVSKFLSQDIENILAGNFNCTLYDEDRHEYKPTSRKTTEKRRAEILKLMTGYEMYVFIQNGSQNIVTSLISSHIVC